MSIQQKELFVRLVGPVTVFDKMGNDLTPRGQKACGLLALLALAPRFSRSRKWVQDKLWSDRGEEQGAASLRQTLSEIRRAFGSNRDCIISNRTFLSLDSERVTVESSENSNLTNRPNDTIFLDGLDIKDPEFEHWLREQRDHFGDLQEKKYFSNEELLASGPTLDVNTKPRLGIILLRKSEGDSNYNSVRADIMSDTIAKIASESGMVDVVDWRTALDDHQAFQHSGYNGHTLAIQTDFSESLNGAVYRVLLFDPATNRMIWSTSIGNLDLSSEQTNNYLQDPILLQSLNVAASVISDELHKLPQGEETSAQQYCFQGIQHLYKLGKNNLEIADALFSNAYELDPRGIYLAWKGYLRTFLIAERFCESEKVTSEEALQFAHKAMERDPHNSFVLSLCAHVFAITQSSYAVAHELANRSIEINSANPLGWICLAVAESQIGDVSKAFYCAQRARKIAGTTPFRYHIDALACIVGVLSGNLKEAEASGEVSHAQAPNFSAPMRFLAGLYFHNKKYELAESMLLKLNTLEPDFSLELLHEGPYPVESLRRSVLIKSIPKNI